MPKNDQLKKDKEKNLREIQFVTESMNVYETALEMDEGKEKQKDGNNNP
ncbi:hypothetical protein ACFO25_19110 [Paenactinomyces guangxiensis]|uniref:Uncharacterized protein n=1 Tax=Paenactinomyces guangxiensis TaxID=1490290 RepID=A0A7W2A9P7_9BACL|nr:hypothetical protein [Paenactinomyces guangxiensis]MBA4495422.1 hypothetical protein [Paenactinomyces guangxiensis]MBH8592457.1 hypothetical protein [Paenactinomyces guangxiensis]